MADPAHAPSPDHDWDVFDVSEEEDMRRDAEAIAVLEAHGGVPHEEVAAWLLTCGTPDEKPAPAHWFNSSGSAGLS